jgi:hypothetical protein
MTERATHFCFDPAAFSASHASFDPDAFLRTVQTRGTPIGVISADCQTFNKSLNQRLIDLLNRDYADFINLSLHLDGTPESISRVVEPVAAFRKQAVPVMQQVRERQRIC